MIPVPQKRARLGRLGFHVVAIQVSVSGVCAPTHLLRTVLVDAVVCGEMLVTVGVVAGHDEGAQSATLRSTCRAAAPGKHPCRPFRPRGWSSVCRLPGDSPCEWPPD